MINALNSRFVFDIEKKVIKKATLLLIAIPAVGNLVCLANRPSITLAICSFARETEAVE